MKCFNHTNLDAVAVCKNCGKALCKDCTKEVNSEVGIVCKEKCEDRAKDVNEVINFNMNAIKSKNSTYLFYFGLLSLIGSGFLTTGLDQLSYESNTGYFLLLIGSLLLMQAVANLIRHFKMKRN